MRCLGRALGRAGVRRPPAATRSCWPGRPTRYFVERGYVFVAQDTRGRGDSEGAFEFFAGDGPDGYDSIEWLAGQPWSTGKVGTLGLSYSALSNGWRPRNGRLISPAWRRPRRAAAGSTRSRTWAEPSRSSGR